MSVSAPIHLPIICKASPIFIGLLFRNRSGVINQLGQVYPGGASCANRLIIESKRFSSDREEEKKLLSPQSIYLAVSYRPAFLLTHC